MVDHADFIIAVWDGRSSGTGKTVQYAQRQGKPVTIINPKTMSVD
jgi:nucleoside 2-deoxyribosyltransferase